jgi:DNA-binding transcriptional ArsR family regulator
MSKGNAGAGVRNLDPRPLTDAKEMRALAHPVRLALLEALVRVGPLTATEAAEIVDESPANCSFHLRTLAKYGFVEEAEGGTGRQRPWRRVDLGTSFTAEHESPELATAAHALGSLHRERLFDRIRAYEATRRTFPEAWRKVAFEDATITYLTAAELEEVETEILAIFQRYRDRTADPSARPRGARPVSLAAFGHPMAPLRAGAVEAP